MSAAGSGTALDALYINGVERNAFGSVRLSSYRGIRASRLCFEVGAGEAQIGAQTEAQIGAKIGDRVELYCGGEGLFSGKIFELEKKSESGGGLSCTAYDLLRYFRNRDTYSYSGASASDVLSMILSIYRFPRGDVRDTHYKIAQRIDDEATLAEIMENALAMTAAAGFGDYLLFDDFGKISLLPSSELRREGVISSDICRKYKIVKSIDSDFYSSVKLRDTSGGERKFFVRRCEDSIERYGLIQYYGAVAPDEFGDHIAGDILSVYGSPSVSLECELFRADTSLRGGVTAEADIDGERRELVCERCEHIFSAGGDMTSALFTSI